MSKPIVLSEAKWAALHYKLSQDYHSSVILIRTKMRHVLGFTVRKHTEWVMPPGANSKTKRYPVNQICLDFYNEPKRTMFLLKYSEYLDNER